MWTKKKRTLQLYLFLEMLGTCWQAERYHHVAVHYNIEDVVYCRCSVCVFFLSTFVGTRWHGETYHSTFEHVYLRGLLSLSFLYFAVRALRMSLGAPFDILG